MLNIMAHNRWDAIHHIPRRNAYSGLGARFYCLKKFLPFPPTFGKIYIPLLTSSLWGKKV